METSGSAVVATLGGGCFWCLEAVLQELRGVRRVESGYGGGIAPRPSYHEVVSGATGHAEVVRVTFDPEKLAYRELLEVFFAIHDPTTLNRQGFDVGTQYRSVIFHHDEEQRRTALELIEELGKSGQWPDPIVTEVLPAGEFYPAEDYHQNYYRNNPTQAYCQAVIVPKLAGFRERFARRVRDSGRRGHPQPASGKVR